MSISGEFWPGLRPIFGFWKSENFKVGEEGADAEEDLGDGEGGAPVVLQDVQADDALGVDVAVVDTGLEGHLQEEYFIVQFIKFKF